MPAASLLTMWPSCRRRRCLLTSPSAAARRRLPSCLSCRRLLRLLGHLSPKDAPSAAAQQQRRQWQQPQPARALHSSGTLGRTMEDPAAAAANAHAKAAMSQAVHPSPSAQHLSQLTKILNARDLAEASPTLKPGKQGQGVAGGWPGAFGPVAVAVSLFCRGGYECRQIVITFFPGCVKTHCLALCAGRLIRSGSPAHASLEDVLLLRRELHVQQVGWGSYKCTCGGQLDLG